MLLLRLVRFAFAACLVAWLTPGSFAAEIRLLRVSKSAAFTAAQFQASKPKYEDVLPVAVSIVGLSRKNPDMTGEELFRSAIRFSDEARASRKDSLVIALGVGAFLPHPAAAPISFIALQAVEKPELWFDRLMPDFSRYERPALPEPLVWSKIEDEASKSPRVRRALSLWFKSRLKFDAEDSPEAILSSVPEIRAQFDLADYYRLQRSETLAAKNAGSGGKKASTLTSPSNGISRVREAVLKQAGEWSHGLGQAQAVVSSPMAVHDVTDSTKLKDRAANVRAAGALFGHLVAASGDPVGGARIAGAADGVSQVMVAAASLMAGGPGLAATAGILGGMTALSSALSGPQVDQTGLQLRALQQQVESLRQVVTSNFRVVLLNQEHAVALQAKVLEEVLKTGRDVQFVLRSTEQFRRLTQDGLEELSRSVQEQALRQRLRALDDCAQFRTYHGQLTYEKFADCVNLAKEVAVKMSVKEAVLPIGSRSTVSGAALVADPYAGIQHIAQELSTAAPSAEWAIDAGSLGNLRVWAFAADTFERLLKDYPLHRKRFKAGEAVFRQEFEEAIGPTLAFLRKLDADVREKESRMIALHSAFAESELVVAQSLEAAFESKLSLLVAGALAEPVYKQTPEVFALCDKFSLRMELGGIGIVEGDERQHCTVDGKQCWPTNRAGPPGFGKPRETDRVSLPRDFEAGVSPELLSMGGRRANQEYRLKPLTFCISRYDWTATGVVNVSVDLSVGEDQFAQHTYQVSNLDGSFEATSQRYVDELSRLLMSPKVKRDYSARLYKVMLTEASAKAASWHQVVGAHIDEGREVTNLASLERRRGAIGGALQLAFVDAFSDGYLAAAFYGAEADLFPTGEWFRRVLLCTQDAQQPGCASAKSVAAELLAGPGANLRSMLQGRAELQKARLGAAISSLAEKTTKREHGP